MLINAITISLICFGVKFSTSEGQVLDFMVGVMECFIASLILTFYFPFLLLFSYSDKARKCDVMLYGTIKPILTCVFCMSSFWTIAYFFTTNTKILQIETAWTMLAACGFSLLIDALIQGAKSIGDVLKFG